MPTLRKGDRTVTVSSREDLRDFIAQGFAPVEDSVVLTDINGRSFEVASEDLDQFLGTPGGVESAVVGAQRDIENRLQSEFGGTAEQFRTFGERAIGAATFGLSDIAGLTGGEDAGRRRRANPAAALGGLAVGAVGPALATGGASLGARALAATPAGLATRAATSIAGRGATLGERVAAGAAGFATEGFLFGAGDYLSHVALEDAELSAEAFLASAGRGALFGAGVGGAFPVAGALFRGAAGGLARRLRVTDSVAPAVDDVAAAPAATFAEPGVETAARNRARLDQLGRDFPHLNDPIGESLARSDPGTTVAGRALRGTPEQGQSTTVGKLWPKAQSQKEAVEKTLVDLRQETARMQDAAAELDAVADRAIRGADDLTASRIAQLREETRALREKWFNDIIPKMRAEKTGREPFWKESGRARGGGRAPVVPRGRAKLPPGRNFPDFPRPRPRTELGPPTLVDRARGVATTTGDTAVDVATRLETKLKEFADEVSNHVNLKEFAPRAADTIVEPMEAALSRQADEVVTQGAGKMDDAVTNPFARQKLLDDASAPVTPGPVVSTSAAAPLPSAGQGAGGRLLDIAAGAEALQSVGVPLPDVDRIPVIGPILGAYLKFRAARALWRGGRQVIGATPATRVAERVAKTRNRMADALTRFSKGSIKKARQVSIPTARAILASPIYDGTTRRGATARQSFADRSDEITRGTDSPAAVQDQLTGAVPDSLPTLAIALGETAGRKMAYLRDHLPTDPREPNPFNGAWHPSSSALNAFARRLRAADDPLSLLDDLNSGDISMDAVDAVKNVWPRLFQEMQQQAIDLAARVGSAMPFRKRIQLSLVFEVVGDPSMSPARLVTSQAPVAPPPELDVAAPAAGALDLAEDEMLPLQRRLQ